MIPTDSSAELANVEDTKYTSEIDPFEKSDVGIKIFSDVNDGISKYDSLMEHRSNIQINAAFDNIDKNEMVVIDQEWANKQTDSMLKDNIQRCIENNNAVMLISESPQLLIDSRDPIEFRSYVNDCQVYGILSLPDGRECCYSVGGYIDIDDAINAAYELVSNDMSAKASNDTNISFVGEWGAQKLSRFTYQCNVKNNIEGTSYTNIGKFNIATAYFPIIEKDPDYNYYLTCYFFQSVPADSYRTADMAITTDVDATADYGQYQQLVRYAPTATSGTSSVNIGLGITTSLSGMSINASASWSYNTPDVTILDKSDMEYNIMDLGHDIPEDKNAGIGSYVIQPGNLVMVSTQGDGAYHAEEEYRGGICHHVLGNIFNRFREFSTTASTVVPPQ